MVRNGKLLPVYFAVAWAGTFLMVLVMRGTALAESRAFELGYSPAIPERHTEHEEIGGKDQQLGPKGEWDRFRYWGEDGFFDTAFTNHMGSAPQDSAGGRFGAEFNIGLLTPKVEFARFGNSAAGDAMQSITSVGRVSVDVKAPQWPVLTLAYGREFRENRVRLTGPTTEDVSSDTISGTLWYGRPTWDAYATSSYSSKQDRRNVNSEAVVYGHILGGSYRPIESLSIHPSFEFTQTFDSQSDYRYETLSANLGIYYSLAPESLTLSLHGSFTADRDLGRYGGYVDTQTLATHIAVAKQLGSAFGLPDDNAKLSFTLNHYQYTDRVYGDANLEDYSALVLLDITF